MNRPRGRSSAAGTRVLVEPGTWERLRLAWRLYRDPRVAPIAKLAVPALTALYVLSPIDLVPDVLLGAGQVDDLGVVVVALLALSRLLPRLAPAAVVEEHLRAMGLSSPEPERGVPERDVDVVEASFRVKGEPAGDRDPAAGVRGHD